MGRDFVSTPMESVENSIRQTQKARLEALKSRIETHRHAELKCHVIPLLHVAAKEGNVNKFLEALERYSTESNIIDIQGPSGNSLFHVAAGNEKADILNVLHEVIPDKQLLNKVNNRGDTALHVAARAGRMRTAEFLLDRGSSLDMANDLGNTPLHEAVKNRHYELTELLLSRDSRSVYKKNEESKCPLYLAIEMGELNIFSRLIEAMHVNEVPCPTIQGISPVYGAVMHRRLDMLRVMLDKKKELFNLRNASGWSPLHLASSVNYVDGVRFFVEKFASSALERDREGYFPIHIACERGHVDTIKELLKCWPNPEDLLDLKEGQNMLHVAAKYGMASTVEWILSKSQLENLINVKDLEKLINAKDKEGNTPLHVATLQWQPKVLFYLTRDKRVDVKLVNSKNLTAHDIVDENLQTTDAPFREIWTRIVLASAKAPRSKDKAICRPTSLEPWRRLKPPNLDRLKNQANTHMVVATLIAAMTFAAGFSVPGGYNSSESNAGIATLLNKPMFDIFMICNAIAMYSSILSVVILLWTQINDSHAVHHVLRNAWLPLLIALATMSVAFMAGVYVTTSKRTWVAVVMLIVGITALFIVLCLYIALFVPLRYNCGLLQLFADYIIKVGISISESEPEGSTRGPARFDIRNCFPGLLRAQVASENVGYENSRFDAFDQFNCRIQ